MKALLVLVLLSMASTSNAAVELSCYSEGLSKTSRTTMIQEGKNFTITKTSMENNAKRTVVTRLYTNGKPVKTTLGDTIYVGLAETNYCIDGCVEKQDFYLKVPQILQNRVVLTLSADQGDGKEVVSEIGFRCARPDNR